MRQYDLTDAHAVQVGHEASEAVRTQGLAHGGPAVLVSGAEAERIEQDAIEAAAVLNAVLGAEETVTGVPLGVTPQGPPSDSGSSGASGGEWTLQGVNSAGAVQERWAKLKKELKWSKAGVRRQEEELSQLQQLKREQEEELAVQAAVVEELREQQATHQHDF